MKRDDKDPRQNIFKRKLSFSQVLTLQDAKEFAEFAQAEFDKAGSAILEALKSQDVRDLESATRFYREALEDGKTGFGLLDKLRRELHTHPRH